MAIRHVSVLARALQAQGAAAIATYAIARPQPDLREQLWGGAAGGSDDSRPPSGLREAVAACASRIATPLARGTPSSFEGALVNSNQPRAVVEPHAPYRAVHVNAALEQLSGISGEEARGAPLSAVLHALCADAGALESVADAASAAGRAQLACGPAAEGAPAPRIQLSPLYDASGAVSHLLAVVVAAAGEGAAAPAVARQ